ncbi:methionyl-tRNA formyltransferase [Evansella tamaricis]|uniref:Methionyl-tRNA formyltransferase n=1 Tax=Evansella tamaricis TaxID=2069301 RepID=A0ABS6JJG2_9BACI|nr:methionyl-tRNA formyltransferase [Evansella tamaricis]MBU9712463.1 methionyl-tRNA formyltransferase [Evansella tamaricis]
MRVVFMGTPDFAVPVLEEIIEKGYDVCLVVTQPDRPKGRKQTLTPPPVKVAAEKHGLTVFQPEKIKNETEWRKVEEVNPDIIITAAFGQILPKGLLEIPPLGCVNVHASLLPKYRGGAPIHQAIIDGERETGISIMYMVEKLDAGAILNQRSIPIEEKDTTGSLHDKLSGLGATLLLETLPELEAGSIVAEEQDETEASYAPNIKREQEIINWSNSAEEIYNQVRGLNPWPVAYTFHEKNRLKIWWTEKTENFTDEKPGTVIKLEEDSFSVACGEKTVLKVMEIQPSGKKRMDVKTFLQGAGKRWNPGMMLGESDETR